MNNPLTVKINDHLTYIGVNDRYTHLFEGMWPLPDGISYNSYLLDGGDEVCLLDCVKIPSIDEFLANIYSVLGDRDIDYVVVNHMEPDHTSSLPVLVERFPNIKIIGNKKTKDFLDHFYDLTENILVVKDGEEVAIGNTSLTFYTTPMVHWPESMVAFEKSTGTLFSQDAFGGYGTLDGAIFDDEINFDFYKDETIRYYTNIVGKYSGQVVRALDKLKDLDIKTICPDHGIVWRKNPGIIVDLYSKLANQETENGVLLVYGSMYGHTEKMAEMIARSMAEEGISNIRIRNISEYPLSNLIAEAWRYRGILLGCPTYNVGLFPPMANFVATLTKQKMKNHIFGYFSSYSWGGGAEKEFAAFAEKCKWDFLETTPNVQGALKEDDIEECMKLGREMAAALKEAYPDQYK